MDRQTASKRSRQVGAGSLAIGVGFLAAPERFGRPTDLDPGKARLIGVADLAVGAGLVWGRSPRAWMLSRGALNLAIAGLLFHRRTRRARLGAAALCTVTLGDLQVVATLAERRADAAPSAYARLNAAASEALNRRGIYLGRRATRIHVALYRRSGGRLGAHLPGWPGAKVALVDHRGAKTGRPRTSPLMYHADGGTIVVVASKAGQPTNPSWFHNLMADPETTVQIGEDVRPVRARLATEEERERLWPEFLAFYPGYAAFRERASPRIIPIVLLEPRPAG
jgi:deazaflavin-dependent oxidoreductase (nitroreductase family)